MQNRSTAFSHRGGDTVLMERLKEGLESRGVEVKFDTEMRENPADYDLVHLFNFALPELLKAQASVAARACTPFVVSTLYEDAPTFHNESIEWGRLLIEYVRRGQDRVWFEQAAASVRSTSSPRFQNDWIANNAAALFSNGKRESDTLLRDYGMGCRTREIHLGHELPSGGDPDLFVRKYGVKNFVFCVGRFETRKNQLMLLKALEDSELPVVLAGGGFSYQPDYEWAVKNFKRKGLTVILDQVSSEMLASAYRACRVHALPSWYELPGLVTLEAAHCAKNVVATMNGTTWDYMGELAFYCSPSCWRSVSNAVMAAWHSPVKPGIAEWVGQYTWEKTALNYERLYEKMISEFSASSEEIKI